MFVLRFIVAAGVLVALARAALGIAAHLWNCPLLSDESEVIEAILAGQQKMRQVDEAMRAGERAMQDAVRKTYGSQA